MGKLIRHKWKVLKNDNKPFIVDTQCEKCGTICYWDFDYSCIMYKWGTHVTYKPPSCLLPNTLNYNGKKI